MTMQDCQCFQMPNQEEMQVHPDPELPVNLLFWMKQCLHREWKEGHQPVIYLYHLDGMHLQHQPVTEVNTKWPF